MPENTCWINNDGTRSLLQKIQAAGLPLRSIDEGRPHNLLKAALEQTVPPNRLKAIEPLTYGSGSIEAFLDMATKFLPPSDRWVLAILASDLIDWVWRETRGVGSGSKTTSPVEHLGSMPIAIPPPDYRERLGEFVARIVDEIGDEPLILEIKADLDERVYSTYRLDCHDIYLVEDTKE